MDGPYFSLENYRSMGRLNTGPDDSLSIHPNKNVKLWVYDRRVEDGWEENGVV
jgi:hypothetical protein